VVRPTGARIGNLAYRHGGKQKKLTIGAYPAVTLAEARLQREQAKALLTTGVDPSQQKQLDKLAQALAVETTFKIVGEEWFERRTDAGKAARTLTKEKRPQQGRNRMETRHPRLKLQAHGHAGDSVTIILPSQGRLTTLKARC
jgi:hypothetical protein